MDHSLTYQDDDGRAWTPGKCTCEGLELVKQITTVVIEALEQLDNILCTIMLTTVNAIVTTAFEVIPGAQELPLVSRLVTGAKTFHENGLEAASFFGDMSD